MIEVRNRTPGPVQLIVRSFSEKRKHPKAFTCLNIPGYKKKFISDERSVPIYIQRMEKDGLISTRHIPDSEIEDQEIL